ncbi:MAG: hypothetical protein V4668_03470 [Patescibacteria group bacterium]
MSPLKDQAQIDEIRRRLYERGAQPGVTPRHNLSKVAETPQTRWPGQKPLPQPEIYPADQRGEVLDEPTVDVHEVKVPKKRFRFTFRTIMLILALGTFLAAILFSSFYMLFGNNQISNKNISININAPLTIGGGEVMDIQISVTNQNKVPIESAVLIVNYPVGSKSTDLPAKDLYEERITLNRIEAGEAINIPLKAVMFGEENQERQIKATIEYRLVDSNGTFYKESDPLTFKISSSPVVIRVESIKKVSAGQDIEVKLTIQSNASTPLKDVLVTANYPTNFDFSSAEPTPVFRESAWLIKELLPETSTTIVIKGGILGKQTEEFQIQFSAGTAQQDNQFMIGSVLANAIADFVIEQPFIDVGIGVNNLTTEVVTLPTGQDTQVEVSVQNTLDQTLYDMAVEVAVKGNILVRENVQVNKGFYDSVKDVIRFDPSGDKTLGAVAPGATKKFIFTLRPGDQKSTPSYTLTANAYARRVNETSATEQLVGTAKTEVKFTSSVAITRTIGRSVPGFTDVGPIPPAPDIKTSYTVTLTTSAGGNDVTGGVLTTSLPQYVSWENLSSGDGTLAFNPISKELTWTVGEIKAGAKKTTTFQIALLPSQNQIGTTPAVLGTQRFRATDRFTNQVIRAEGPPASSELGIESGFEQNNGEVTRP